MEKQVLKRDGTRETLDIKKIQKYTADAVKGLSNVSQSELELDAHLQFKDGITTEEIQETLIKTAVDKIDIDAPNWTFVAARLFNYNLKHIVGKNINGNKGQAYCHLKDYFEFGEKEGKIILGLKELFDLDLLNEYIKPERDELFNYLGIRTLYDRYLLKDNNSVPFELPQQMFMGIAMFLAQREKPEVRNEWAMKFYDMISSFEVMLATPTLSNARTPRHQLSSCYIGSTPDNIEGIFDAYKEMALLSKYGGGIGWDWTLVRSMGGSIDGHKKAAGGTVPFLKIANDLAIAVDQLGTRKGAIAVYLEPWHLDINDFLDLKKNSGEERRRAHDLFPALWLNDLFMERVQKNENWTLFDPFQVKQLTNLHGKEFEKEYKRLEKEQTITKEVISAKDLWKKILTSYFESGSPFLCFKDNANRANPNSHSGIIRSSNLCTEIFQNTKPNEYKVKITYQDGTVEIFDEDTIITTDTKTTKKANKLTSIDSLNGKQIVVAEKQSFDGDTAVCNLASINLSKVNTEEKIKEIVPIAIRALDNVIDLNFYPVDKVRKTNLKTRAIGLGVMGEAQMLAEREIHWGSIEHFNKIDELMETISFNAINSSCDLAIEKGEYPEFKGSNWEKGIFPMDHVKKQVNELTSRRHSQKWKELKEKVKENGMRNGYLMAVAPTSSISILTGTTQAIEPVYKKKWFEENLSGLIPVVVPNLSAETWGFYTTAYELDQRILIKAGSIRQKWLDQGQSLNIFVTLDKASGKYLNDIYMLAWELGLKSTYYLRSESPQMKEEASVADRSIECTGCQ